jgi:hypothetical protein
MKFSIFGKLAKLSKQTPSKPIVEVGTFQHTCCLPVLNAVLQSSKSAADGWQQLDFGKRTQIFPMCLPLVDKSDLIRDGGL